MAEVKVSDVIKVDKMFSGVTDGKVSTQMANKAWERDTASRTIERLTTINENKLFQIIKMNIPQVKTITCIYNGDCYILWKGNTSAFNP